MKSSVVVVDKRYRRQTAWLYIRPIFAQGPNVNVAETLEYTDSGRHLQQKTTLEPHKGNNINLPNIHHRITITWVTLVLVDIDGIGYIDTRSRWKHHTPPMSERDKPMGCGNGQLLL